VGPVRARAEYVVGIDHTSVTPEAPGNPTGCVGDVHELRPDRHGGLVPVSQSSIRRIPQTRPVGRVADDRASFSSSVVPVFQPQGA
jgi:hypothetical protein